MTDIAKLRKWSEALGRFAKLEGAMLSGTPDECSLDIFEPLGGIIKDAFVWGDIRAARQAKAEIDAEIAGAGEQTCYECGSELAVKVCLNCNREIAPAPLDVAIKALEDVYRFILAEYSDPEELALRGEPIAREAQNIWNTVCIAIAALRQHQDGGAG